MRSFRCVLCLVVLVGVLPASVAGAPAGEDTATPADPAAAGRVTDAQLREIVDRVQAEVEQIRGLRFKRPVQAEVIDDDRAREHALRRFERFYGAEAYAREERALKRLGVLPADVDTLEAYLGFLREQAGGFYSPESGSLFLLDDMSPDAVPMIVSHELTHALEDQHFALDERLERARRDGDLSFARSAVHEGSAMLVMTTYLTRAVMRGELTLEQLTAITEDEVHRAEALADFPVQLLRPALGAYTLGMSFLTRGAAPHTTLLAGFPRRSVDGAYSDGPLSSEQILHPEKYWDPAQRDDPTLVRPGRAGRALGRGFKRLAHGVLGELMLGCMVDAPTPSGPAAVTVTDGAAWTNAAAEGWDGDRWELWGRGDTEIVLLTTVWDSAEDAEEFRVALEGRDGFRVRSRDNRVAVVAGAADARAERALERMLPAPRH